MSEDLDKLTVSELNDLAEKLHLEIMDLYDQEESEETYAQASRGKGSVIVFDSRSIHEVTPITSGTRYSLVKWYHGDEPLK